MQTLPSEEMTTPHHLQWCLLAAAWLPACSTAGGRPSQHSSQPLDGAVTVTATCTWLACRPQNCTMRLVTRNCLLGPFACLLCSSKRLAGSVCGAGKRHTPPRQGLTSSDFPASTACLLSCTSSSSSGSPASTAAAYLFVLLLACACWASKAGAGGAARPSPPWTAAATTAFQASGRLVHTLVQGTALPVINGHRVCNINRCRLSAWPEPAGACSWCHALS